MIYLSSYTVPDNAKKNIFKASEKCDLHVSCFWLIFQHLFDMERRGFTFHALTVVDSHLVSSDNARNRDVAKHVIRTQELVKNAQKVTIVLFREMFQNSR